MGRLAELMGYGPQPVATGADAMLNAWEGKPYAQLSVILVWLRYLGMLHQTHHWISKGDPFYGDHLLYMRLYEGEDGEGGIVGEIDMLAEKAVGMGGEENVCLCTHVEELYKLAEMMNDIDGVPTPESLVKQSLKAEVMFIKVVDAMCESMKAQGTCTPGIENMLQGLCDAHEGHVYLLKRRCMASSSGF